MASSGGVQELLACQISAWYPAFARVTFKTAILPLPPAVADWLVSDGLHLAPDSQAFAKRGQLEEYPDEDDYQDWSEDGSEAGGSGSEEAAAQPPPPELEQLKSQVQAAIEELGGRVVPKLSWSCPKDAVWMSPSSSLACTNADEVLLLLRASDRVAHDICHALAEAAAAAAAVESSGRSSSAAGSDAPAPAAVQHCLALRRWYDLQPGREFRCFVRGQALVGASQRDLTQCFEFLKEAGERRELAEAICAFHDKHIQGRFPLPDYTYDVYVATSGAVRLLDFNPVGGTTAPLLFSWQELGLGGGAGGAAAAGEAAGGAAAEAAAAPEAAGKKAGSAVGAAAAAGGRGSSAAEQPAAAAACCGGTCAAQHEAGAGAAVAGEPSYLEQLRRVRALSLAEQQQGSSASGVATEQQQGSSASGVATEQQQAQQAPPQQAQQPRQQLELRVIEEPVALRPHTLAYGVPFDFVDSSEGSALERLMAQTQQAGAPELWAALAAQSGGVSGAEN